MQNKIVVKTTDVEGNEIELAVLRPGPKQTEEAQLCANRAFGKALSSNALFRRSLTKYMRQQNLWDDEKEKQYNDLIKTVNDKEVKLKKGGIKLTEAKEIALQIKLARLLLQELVSQKNELDQMTAEGQSENARFNYLVSACTVYNHDGKAFFKDYDEYLNRADEKAAVDCASRLASMLYGLESDFEHKLPENQFLKKYKFVNDDLKMIDKEGNLVNLAGDRVDSAGRRINEDGKLIDKDGNIIDEEGNLMMESEPFLDEEGKPLVEETVAVGD